MNKINKTSDIDAAVIAVIEAVYEAIAAAGAEGIPSGHLYAALMGVMNLDTYNGIISGLKSNGKITDNGYLLKSTKGL